MKGGLAARFGEARGLGIIKTKRSVSESSGRGSLIYRVLKLGQ